ncbi:iron-containing redox enzyme family protein [Actinoplanes sp. NPDC049599]|uniref:iron-containing redox enzyme family protein n=1 Tax=Actinoplanes sp. NPDC049599 TaxID=3363903 RepID=UPI0037AA6F21
MPAIELPDRTTSLSARTFEFDPSAAAPASAILTGRPAEALHRLLRDQESQVGLLVARRVVAAFLDEHTARRSVPAEDAAALTARIVGVRAGLASRLEALAAVADTEVRDAVLRQRAPLALLGGCWLDTLSQPATQPAVIVNQLFGQHFVLHGEGNPQRGIHHQRRRALEEAGVYLPAIDAVDFLSQARTRDLTALHGLFQLSLSRLSASFLPETTGAHVAHHLLGVDDRLLGRTPRLSDTDLGEVLLDYAAAAGPADWQRLVTAADLVVALEREHVDLLEATARWYADLPLEGKVCEIIGRHAPYAGRQHGEVRVAGRKLSELLDDPELNLAAFVRTMRNSRQLKAIRGGDGRFLRAIKFGGPMFGIFDEREAAVFRAWAEAAAAGTLPDTDPPVNRLGDQAAARWTAALRAAEPADVGYAVAAPPDDRALFHRLVNIESYPNTLPIAREHAAANLAAAEMLFTFGAGGRFTDASWLDYTPAALLERVEQIYWKKLVDPYRPLTEIPDRDEVVFGQKTYALGSLIDGAWAHRIGNVGRYHRISDGMLASIYADEMGRGDVRKNHITLIVRVLHSMGIDVPHIRDDAFLDQGELPDHLYGFSIHQLSLALFPDTFYPEILGYNLGIEMFGLGEMRLHEMQKLRHHGFDPGYEEAHLSIDNFSAGHARQSAEIIVGYLDEVARTVGADAVAPEWRRIWRGYASFAYFVEATLVRAMSAPAATAEMTI